mmetsp:Transcript_7058/g.26721  ORF Transcript_7058/g.26721 Transcript_7058/m.26721 type:complete len:343 (-) Transcript_7058:2481-3509(-)
MHAALRNTSPTSKLVWCPISSAVSFQRTCSSAKPLVSFSARANRRTVSSARSFRLCWSSMACVSCCSSAATLSFTERSLSCAALSCAMVSASASSAAFSAARFGLTTFATREYVCIALVHMHRLMAALDCRATCSGVYSGLSTYFVRALTIFGLMWSLSYSNSKLMKSLLPNTFFAVSQSVFSPNSKQTASMVICTSGGGLGNPFTSTMSALFSAFSDFTALSSAGMASSRSACADAAMSFVSSACFVATASSAATAVSTSAASSLSPATCTRSISVAAAFSFKTGCSSPSSIFIAATRAFVSSSFCNPFNSRSRAPPSSVRFSSSRLVYRWIKSRYDFGVT